MLLIFWIKIKGQWFVSDNTILKWKSSQNKANNKYTYHQNNKEYKGIFCNDTWNILVH